MTQAVISRPFFRKTARFHAADAALFCLVAAIPSFALAQDAAHDPANYAWQAGAIRHAQKMRAYFDTDGGAQPTPPVIPKFDIGFDPSGLIATAQPSGPTLTSQNAFFTNLGTNGRTCFSCHQPQNGWTVSAASVQARFYASFGTDPIFRLVDGATCPTDDVSSIEAKHQAYSLLLSKGLIRIGLPVPATAQFRIASVDDPYNCNTNPATGLTSPTSGIVSVYRRPLPATNLGFLSAIMCDGREPSLASQAIDAPLGLNPKGTPFTSTIFDLYQAWRKIGGYGDEAAYRRSVARGEDLFNNTPINITGVAGLNDVLNQPSIQGVCGTCHDTPDVGNHSVKAPLNISVANAGADAPPALDISGLPVFTLQCVTGPLAGKSFAVTDPGRALISGNCADIGKLKGPILRGLAGRAPYFHNGSAATLF